jgi:hypothetical protein
MLGWNLKIAAVLSPHFLELLHGNITSPSQRDLGFGEDSLLLECDTVSPLECFRPFEGFGCFRLQELSSPREIHPTSGRFLNL